MLQPITMNKPLLFLGLALLVPVCSVKAVNVLAGASVTLNGTYFVGDDFWAPGTAAPAASLTDSTFLSAGSQWNINTVWWNRTTYPGNTIVLNLAGPVQITQFTAQADNNDTYLLEYWTGTNWQSAWAIGTVGAAGMQTRTSGAVNITTNQLRFTVTGGDAYASVSELQAEGSRIQGVPDAGASWMLLAIGLVSLRFIRRR